MAGVATCAAWLLAGVFVAAAASKLRDPASTAATFGDLGLPSPGALGRIVPAAELAIAVALLVSPAGGGLAALGALAFFSTVLASRIRAGSTASCGCFGATGSQPISWVELVRNGLFGGFAAVALAAARPELPGLDDVIATSTAAVVALLILALCALRRDLGHVWDNRLAGEPRRAGS